MYDDTIVSNISITATDDGASSTLREIGGSANSAAREMQAAADQLNAAMARIVGSVDQLGSSTAAMSAGFGGATDAIGALGAEATRLDGIFTSLAGGMSKADGALGILRSTASATSGQLGGLRAEAGALDDAFHGLETVTIDTKMGLRAVGEEADFLANQLARTTGATVDLERALGSVTGKLDVLSARLDTLVGSADGAAASLDRVAGAGKGLAIEADRVVAGFDAEASSADRAAAANNRLADSQKRVRDSSGSGYVGGSSGGHGGTSSHSAVHTGARGALYAGGLLDALGLGSLYEAANFQGAFQAAGTNALLPQQVIQDISKQGLNLFASGPVGYKDIAAAYQRAGEQFQQHAHESDQAYADRLTTIVEESWKSAIAGYGNLPAISQALSKIEFDFGLTQGQSQHAMDITHAIGGYGGNMDITDLSKFISRPAALASQLDFSLPQLGGLFDVLSKQYGPQNSATFLTGLFQHMQSQTPGAHKMLEALGLSKEFSEAGAREYGPYKLITDLWDRANALAANSHGVLTVGDILRPIVPSYRGGLALDSLMNHGHLQMAEDTTQKLGGTLGHDQSPLGDGSHADIYGVTQRQFQASMKTIGDIFKTIEDKAKAFAVVIGDIVAPAFEKLAGPITSAIDWLKNFANSHKELVTNLAEAGMAITGFGLALEGLVLLANPITLVATALVGISLALKDAYDHNAVFRETVQRVADALGPLGNTILPTVRGALGDIQSILGNLSGGFSDTNTHVVAFNGHLQQLSSTPSGFLANLMQGVASLGAGLRDVGSVLQAVGGFLSSFFGEMGKNMPEMHQFGDLLTTVKSALGQVGTAFGDLFKSLDLFQGKSHDAASGGKQFADVLTATLKVALDLIIVAVKITADGITTFVGVLRDGVNLAKTVIGDFVQVVRDYGTMLHDIITGQWGKIVPDYAKILGDVSKLVVDFVANDLKLFSNFAGNFLKLGADMLDSLLKLFGDLFNSLTGQTIPTGLSGIMSALGTLGGKLAAWAGGIKDQFLKAAGDWLGSMAKGLLGPQGNDIKDALVKVVTEAITAALGAVKSIPLVGGIAGLLGVGNNTHNGGGVPSASGGGGWDGNPATLGGAFGVPGPFYNSGVESGNLQMYAALGIPYTGSLQDWDYASMPKPVYLPGGKSAVYEFLRSFSLPGMGTADFFRTPNGGDVQTNHMQGAAPFAPGEIVRGGTYIGMSGEPTSSQYGSGYHLCIVTDSLGREYLAALSPQQYAQAVAAGQGTAHGGGGAPSGGANRFSDGGWAPSVALAATNAALARALNDPTPSLISTTGTGYNTVNQLASHSYKEPAYNSFASAQAGLQQMGAQVFPADLAMLQGLPSSIADKLRSSLQNIGVDWQNAAKDYNNGLTAEDARHRTALQNIGDSYAQKQRNLLDQYGIADTTRHENALRQLDGLLAKANEAQRHTLNDAHLQATARQQQYLAQEGDVYAKAAAERKALQEKSASSGLPIDKSALDAISQKEDAAAAKLSTALGIRVDQAKAMLDENLRHGQANRDQALKNLESSLGIKRQEAESMLNLHLSKLNQQETTAINNEEQKHQKLLTGLQTAFDKHVNGIHGELAKWLDGLKSATSPAQIMQAIIAGAQKTQKDATDAIALHLLSGDLNGKVIPLTADQRRMNALLAANGDTAGQARPSDMQAAVDNKKAQEAAASVQAQAQVSIAQDRAAVMVDLLTGNVSDLNSKLGDMASIITDRVMAGYLAGQPIQEQDIQALAQLGEAQAAASVGLDYLKARVDLVTGDLSSMSSALGSVSTFVTNAALAQIATGKSVSSYLDTLAQVANAQDLAKQAQEGLTAQIALTRNDLAGISAAATTFANDALAGWQRQVLATGQIQNQYTGDIIKAAEAQRAFTTAQNEQNIIIGRLTGSAQLLDGGLKGLLSTAQDKISFFIDSIGRSSDGLNTNSGDITQLGNKAIAAASNLGSLSDIISGLQGTSSSLLSAAETQYARTGSIDPATLNEYAAATGKATAATWDQVAADLQVYQRTGDLANYQKTLGTEIQLQTNLVGHLSSVYGANSAQVQQAQAKLLALQQESQGLTDEMQHLTQGTQLTAQQTQNANAALVGFQSGNDAATLALAGNTVIIKAAGGDQQALNDALQTGKTDVNDLATSAEKAAGSLGDLITSIGSAVAKIGAAIAGLANAGSAGAASSGSSSWGSGGAGTESHTPTSGTSGPPTVDLTGMGVFGQGYADARSGIHNNPYNGASAMGIAYEDGWQKGRQGAPAGPAYLDGGPTFGSSFGAGTTGIPAPAPTGPGTGTAGIPGSGTPGTYPSGVGSTNPTSMPWNAPGAPGTPPINIGVVNTYPQYASWQQAAQALGAGPDNMIPGTGLTMYGWHTVLENLRGAWAAGQNPSNTVPMTSVNGINVPAYLLPGYGAGDKTFGLNTGTMVDTRNLLAPVTPDMAGVTGGRGGLMAAVAASVKTIAANTTQIAQQQQTSASSTQAAAQQLLGLLRQNFQLQKTMEANGKAVGHADFYAFLQSAGMAGVAMLAGNAL